MLFFQANCRLSRMRGLCRKILGIFLITIIFNSCDSDRDFAQQIDNMSMRHLDNYNFNKENSFSQRINVSGDMVLKYMREMDSHPNYTLYNPTESEKSMLEEYLCLLPPYIYDLCKKRLVGIYFLNDFYGSGLTDFIYGENGEIYTILALNPLVFEKNISQLFTYKDNSCFKNENRDIRLEIEISNSYKGLLYILFHETAHIVDYVERETPYVHMTMKRLGFVKDNNALFTDQYWSAYRIPIETLELKYNDSLRFYAEEDERLISNRNMISVYRELEGSPFCSLYSTSNWAEDYAEYISLYYMTQVLKLKYNIKIFENEKLIYKYAPFENEQVLKRAEKLKILSPL